MKISDRDRSNYLKGLLILAKRDKVLAESEEKIIKDIASRMTYIELSADNSFFEAFTSALFLPHTDMTLFPSVVVS